MGGRVGTATGRRVHSPSQRQGRGPARALSPRPHPGPARGGAARAAAWRRSSLPRVGGAPLRPLGPWLPPRWDGGGLTYPSLPLPRPRGWPGPGGVAWGRGRGTAAAGREEAGSGAGASPPARGALERACGAGPAAPPRGPHCSAAGGGSGGAAAPGEPPSFELSVAEPLHECVQPPARPARASLPPCPPRSLPGLARPERASERASGAAPRRPPSLRPPALPRSPLRAPPPSGPPARPAPSPVPGRSGLFTHN